MKKKLRRDIRRELKKNSDEAYNQLKHEMKTEAQQKFNKLSFRQRAKVAFKMLIGRI